tara:strand:+ start:12305 stop:12928 length:624 start_codon:yes stop_codon:yes gene_type:complete
VSLLGNGWLVEAVAAIVGIVWLIALWRSVKRVFPIEVGGEDLLHFNRRTLFLLVSLLAAVAPVSIILGVEVPLQLFLWGTSLVADYLLFMYWFLSDYTSTSFYAELRIYHWRLQKSRLYPDDAFTPNWLFHNPWLSIFGLTTISGGTTLLVYHLDWRFVSLPAYGLLYMIVFEPLRRLAGSHHDLARSHRVHERAQCQTLQHHDSVF